MKELQQLLSDFQHQAWMAGKQLALGESSTGDQKDKCLAASKAFEVEMNKTKDRLLVLMSKE